MVHLQSVLTHLKGSAPRGAPSKQACSNVWMCWSTRVSHMLARLPTLLHLLLIGLIVLVIVVWIGIGFWIVVRLVRTAPAGKRARNQ